MPTLARRGNNISSLDKLPQVAFQITLVNADTLGNPLPAVSAYAIISKCEKLRIDLTCGSGNIAVSDGLPQCGKPWF
jgi:hypothetical protein